MPAHCLGDPVKPVNVSKTMMQGIARKMNPTRIELNDTDVSHVCIVTRGQHKTSEPLQILNTAVLQGWEPDQIRFLQLQDPYISPIMTLLDDASNKPVCME
jgi:hypothetical protein